MLPDFVCLRDGRYGKIISLHGSCKGHEYIQQSLLEFVHLKKKIEYTKWLIGSRKAKYRQYNGQKKRTK